MLFVIALRGLGRVAGYLHSHFGPRRGARLASVLDVEDGHEAGHGHVAQSGSKHSDADMDVDVHVETDAGSLWHGQGCDLVRVPQTGL